MVRRILGSLKLALPLLVLLLPLAAGAQDENIATLRVSNVDAVVADLERLALTLGIPVDGDEVLDDAMMPLKLPGLDLIDRSRPAALVFPARGLAVGANALAAALPVGDVDAALFLLEERFETHGVNESIHTFSRSDGTSLVVRAEEGYLVVGLDSSVVNDLDLATALGGSGIPPGNISMEINLEAVAPFVQAGVMQGRQMLEARMEAEAARGREQGAAESGEADAETEEGGETPGEAGEGTEPEAEITVEPEIDPQDMDPMLDLYFDFVSDAINNLRGMAISIEVTEQHLLLHNWVSPRAGSTFAGIVAAQSGGLPDVARLVDPEGAMIIVAGQVKRTPELDAAAAGYAGRYLKAMGGLLSGLKGQPFVEQLTGMIDELEPLVQQSLDCYSGEMAATVRIGSESGMRMTQVMGIGDDEACRTVLGRSAELLDAIPAGPDGERFLSVTENALSHAGVTANRTEARLLLSLVEDAEGEEAAELMRTMFGDDRLVSYVGLGDEHVICTLGSDAEQAFKDVVDHIGQGGSANGLSEAYFAPLRTGPGFFAAFELGAFFDLVADFAKVEEERQQMEMLGASPGRIVYGGRFSGTGLELGLAFPLETLASWGKAIAAAAEQESEEPEHENGHDEEDVEISVEIGG
jgi:hypothetical protein